jgi:hypothetical protein
MEYNCQLHQAFNTRSWTVDKHPHLFVRTPVCVSALCSPSSPDKTIQVAAYFISLLLSDLIQAIGSILNAMWIRDMAVEVGVVCTVQGEYHFTPLQDNLTWK